MMPAAGTTVNANNNFALCRDAIYGVRPATAAGESPWTP